MRVPGPFVTLIVSHTIHETQKGDPALVNALRGAIVLAATGVLLAGCGGGGGNDKKVAARAGDIEITLTDFHDAYTKISAGNRPDISTLEGRRGFANDLVNQRILVDAARGAGGLLTAEVQKQIDRTSDSEVLGVLYREEVERKVDVLGADVQELYDKRQENVVASHILLDSVEEAQRVRAEIESGAITFEAAAEKYSMDQGNRKRGGSLGEIQWNQMIPAFQAKAFEMKPGEMSEPLETPFGVHLIRVDKRVKAEIPPLEETRITLRSEVRGFLERQRMNAFVKELEERENLTWNEEGIDKLLDAMDVFATVDIDTIPEPERYVPALPAEEQASTVLATFADREWTMADHTAWLSQQPPTQRPFRRIPHNGIKELIRSAEIQEQLLKIEARKRGLYERPEVVEKTKRLEEQILVELYHARFLQEADVPLEDVRAVYDSTLAKDPDAFMYPERVEMLIIPQSATPPVKEALAKIKAGVPEVDVIKEYSVDPVSSARGGNTGLIPRGTWAAPIEDLAFSGVVGKGWLGPIETNTGVAAIKVLKHEQPRRATFEEVRDPLTRQMANARGEAAFEGWLREKRASLDTEINDEVLELYDQPIS